MVKRNLRSKDINTFYYKNNSTGSSKSDRQKRAILGVINAVKLSERLKKMIIEAVENRA